MREDIINILPSTIQASGNVDVQETDDNAYYAEIVEYLNHDSDCDAKRLEEWAAKKSSDPTKWLRIMRRRARNYCLIEGKLYHGCHSNRLKHQVVVGATERREILKRVHIREDTGVHVGVSKMYAELCASYFWQGLYRDVKNFVRNCGTCVEVRSRSVPLAGLCPSPRGSATESKARAEMSDIGSCAVDEHKWKQVCQLGGTEFQARDMSCPSQVWARVEVNILSAPLMGHGKQSMLVLADPVSHWMSAQALTIDSEAVDISEAAALFAFSTFCTLGFPSICSVVRDSGIEVEAMWEKIKSMMEPLKLEWLPKKKKAALLRKGEHKRGAGLQLVPLSSVAGISEDCESQVLPLPIITLNSSSSSTCKWAWETMRAYMGKNEESWHVGLDAFLFEERRRTSAEGRPAFFLMFGRDPVCGGRTIDAEGKAKDVKSKRRKLRSSIFECRHCGEHFTSKISFQIHQKKHTEEAQWRGLREGDDEKTDEGSPKEAALPVPLLHHKVLPNSNKEPRGAQINDLGMAGAEVAATKPGKKVIVRHCSKSTDCNWRKTHLKIGGMKKQCQRGISRLLALAQVGIGEACEKIPMDSQRASFTAQTVASVRASLEAKQKKHIRRGNYQRYSPELREKIAKHALNHGISQTMKHFSSMTGGKSISESTVRNFVRAYCSPTGHSANCLRNKDLGEEIGRFSACAGTEAAVRYYSSRLGLEVKQGTVSRLRRAYLKKHSPPEEGQGVILCKKKGEVTKRKRRYGALLRDEIGNYAAQHGICAATQYYSERLLFPVHEHTITKFLKIYLEKESNKNSMSDKPCELDPHQNSSLQIDKLMTCPTTTTAPPPPSLHQQDESLTPTPLLNNSSDVLDEALVMYGPYAGLTSQQVGYHDSSLPSYVAHSTGQTIILNQGDATAVFCSSQELGYQHSEQGYPPNFEDTGMPPTTVGSLGMDHQASVTDETMSHEGMNGTDHVPMSHIASPYGGRLMAISHQLIDDSQGNASGMLNNHAQVIVTDNREGSQEHVSSEGGHSALGSSSTVMSVLPSSSSFVHHTKSQVLMSSSLMSQGGAAGNVLSNTDIASLQKTMEGEMIPPYYPLNTIHTYQMGNNAINASIQISKDISGEVCAGSQTVILGESLMPTSPIENQNSKTNSKDVLCVSGTASDKPSCFVQTTQQRDAGRCCTLEGEGDVEMDTAGPLPLEENPLESTAVVPSGINGKEKSLPLKEEKKLKCTQKSKRGNYNFLSPELRARIGRYAAEHGNLKAAKHFEAEVGRQIPESTIRGLRDKYMMKQMHVTSAQSNEGHSGDSSQQVTALGYAPRGRPMVLGKYDEVVQDCMHELVKAGERVGSTLAIATARQVLTQYEPSLLEEFGGPIRLNNSWAKSFIKRIGLSSNS